MVVLVLDELRSYPVKLRQRRGRRRGTRWAVELFVRLNLALLLGYLALRKRW